MINQKLFKLCHTHPLTQKIYEFFHTQDELSSLMTKVKDVISENETLSDVHDDAHKPYMKTSKFNVTSGPNILFESRISELEAQLAQTNIDYNKLADENAELKRKRALGGDSTIDIACSEAYKKQIENLQRDKNSLEEMVKKLQKQVSDLKEIDSQVFTKSQRNRDLAEQANFERAQNDIEIRRLKVNTQTKISDNIIMRVLYRFLNRFNSLILFCYRKNWSANMNELENYSTRPQNELSRKEQVLSDVSIIKY